MKKYAKIKDEQTKECIVGLGTDIDFYVSAGMTLQDVEQAYNGGWYLAGYAPVQPTPTLQEQVNALEIQYNMCRWQREGILAQNSQYSQYTKNKAQQIEDLAEELRRQEAANV